MLAKTAISNYLKTQNKRKWISPIQTSNTQLMNLTFKANKTTIAQHVHIP